MKSVFFHPEAKAEFFAAEDYLEAADIDEALAYAAWRAEEVELPMQPV